MEALTAIGLIANIVQFVDLGAKLINSAKEIQASSNGMTMENKNLEKVTTEMRKLTMEFNPLFMEAKTEDERAIGRLAQECRDVSEQILSLLKKITPTKPNSRRQIWGSTLRNQKYKREKKELEEKLANCRAQLHLHFSRLTSIEVKTQLQDLANMARSNHDALEQRLRTELMLVHHSIPAVSLSSEAHDQIKVLFELTRSSKESLATSSILAGLIFDEMRTRAETIEEEHCETFRWIVDPNANVNYTTSASNARELYISWLSRDCGIFHIAGKLGSGKSTLMKFLFGHVETRKQLSTWAGQATLVVASHFFWKPGKQPLQKSLTGMMRSLLFGMIEAHPELTSRAFPKAWAHLTDAQRNIQQTKLGLSPTEVQDAFMALLKNKDIQKSYRFCFFIDALDEFEDSRQHDHRSMVDALRNWTRISPGTIKLCVSSREDNVFENAFAGDSRIRLQDLTRRDMERFARSKLESIHDDALRERLVLEIVNRSDGIFLWVVLVIKQLRQALEDGRDISSFEQELGALPTELEELFKHLLDSISRSHLRKAYQIFVMTHKHEGLGTKLSALSCLYLDAYEADTEFAMKYTFSFPRPDTDDLHDLYIWYDTQNNRARRLIQGYCKGLVEVRPDILPAQSPARSKHVAFVHRSIVEFLEHSSILQHSRILQVVENPLSDFNAIRAISQLHLAEYQSLPAGLIDLNHWCQIYRGILHMRFHVGMDRSQYHFLERLEFVISRKFPGWLETEQSQYCLPIYNVGSDPCTIETTSVGNLHSPGKTELTLRAPLCISAWLGNMSYVHWRLVGPYSRRTPSQAVGIVLHCLRYRLQDLEDAQDLESTVALFEELLDDCTSPETRFLWPRLILDCVQSKHDRSPARFRIAGQLITLFLRKGAMVKLYTTEMEIYPCGDKSISDPRDVQIWFKGTPLFKEAEVYDTPLPLLDFLRLSMRYQTYVPLEGLVRFCNFENETEILRLIKHARNEDGTLGRTPAEKRHFRRACRRRVAFVCALLFLLLAVRTIY